MKVSKQSPLDLLTKDRFKKKRRSEVETVVGGLVGSLFFDAFSVTREYSVYDRVISK
jgi:hypothetical protein